MANGASHNEDRGHEIIGMRLTVYNLLPDFMDPEMTEAEICRFYELTPQQVAPARAYILNNPETVLTRHLEIEARNAAGNSPELKERMKRNHVVFEEFRRWLEKRRTEDPLKGRDDERASSKSHLIPTFREWLAEQESRSVEGP
jgi:uncharacterized protein (DUF433 family)